MSHAKPQATRRWRASLVVCALAMCAHDTAHAAEQERANTPTSTQTATAERVGLHAATRHAFVVPFLSADLTTFLGTAPETLGGASVMPLSLWASGRGVGWYASAETQVMGIMLGNLFGDAILRAPYLLPVVDGNFGWLTHQRPTWRLGFGVHHHMLLFDAPPSFSSNGDRQRGGLLFGLGAGAHAGWTPNRYLELEVFGQLGYDHAITTGHARFGPPFFASARAQMYTRLTESVRLYLSVQSGLYLTGILPLRTTVGIALEHGS